MLCSTQANASANGASVRVVVRASARASARASTSGATAKVLQLLLGPEPEPEVPVVAELVPVPVPGCQSSPSSAGPSLVPAGQVIINIHKKYKIQTNQGFKRV